jgi:alanine adding enzyme
MNYIREVSNEEWAEFSGTRPDFNFLQTTQQHDFLNRRGFFVKTLGWVTSDEQIVGGAVVLMAHSRFGRVMLVSRGPLLADESAANLKAFYAALKSYAQQNGVFEIHVSPNKVQRVYDNDGTILRTENEDFVRYMVKAGLTHVPARKGFDNSAGEPDYQYVKYLDGIGSDKELRESYGSDGIYYLKKNAEFGINTRRLQRADLPAFKALTKETAERIGYHDKDLSFYEKFFDVYGDMVEFYFVEMDFKTYIENQKDRVAALAAKIEVLDGRIAGNPNNKKAVNQRKEFTSQLEAHERRIAEGERLRAEAGADIIPVAGGMFIFLPNEVNYFISGTYEKYKNFYGPYKLQDEMLQKTLALGVKKYNFYGVTGNFDGSDGVLNFKTGFNGEVQEMVGTFILTVKPLRAMLFRLVNRLKKS